MIVLIFSTVSVIRRPLSSRVVFPFTFVFVLDRPTRTPEKKLIGTNMIITDASFQFNINDTTMAKPTPLFFSN